MALIKNGWENNKPLQNVPDYTQHKIALQSKGQELRAGKMFITIDFH